MIEQLGPPTLFLTVSCADWYSPEFIYYLRTVHKNIQGVAKMTPAELTCLDPASVSMHFDKKWTPKFNELILY
jgi:hypothetical protein